MDIECVSTQEALANALIELSKTMPFNRITVRSIATKANVSIRSSYYHFEDKNDLVRWIFARANRKTYDEYFVPTHDFRVFGRQSVASMLENSDYNRNLMENTHGRYALRVMVRKQMYDLFLGHVRDELGGAPVDKEIDFLLSYYMSFCSDALIDWFLGGMEIPADTLVRLTSDEMMPARLRPFLLPG